MADPGGATRTLTTYLPDEKSAVLATTSPAGEGFVPDPGWCGDDDPTSVEQRNSSEPR